MSPALPRFVVVGAAKAGTTALHHLLGRHPRICLPRVKESSFFAFEGRPPVFTGPGDDAAFRSPLCHAVHTLEDYRALFDCEPGRDVLGEVCPTYLYYPAAAQRIHAINPGARIVAILRDPAERAFSAYQMLVDTGREDVWDFERALALEPERVARGWEHAWHYVSMGRYAEQLGRYFDVFGRDGVQVHLYEDYQRAPGAVVGRVLEFIGVEPDAPLDTAERHNVSRMPRSRLAEAILRSPRVRALARAALPESVRRPLARVVVRANRRPATIPPGARRVIVEALSDDVHRLEAMIGRDLSHWLR